MILSYFFFIVCVIQDILENEDIKLDTMFKLSLAIDICRVSKARFYIFSKIFDFCRVSHAFNNAIINKTKILLPRT